MILTYCNGGRYVIIHIHNGRNKNSQGRHLHNNGESLHNIRFILVKNYMGDGGSTPATNDMSFWPWENL